MKMTLILIIGMMQALACTPQFDQIGNDAYNVEQASVASFYVDSVPVDAMETGVYVTEVHGNSNITSNQPVKENTPTVGSITIGANTYNVHPGKTNTKGDRSGSLYINRVSKETGNPYRMYLSTTQKGKVDFY